MYAQVVFPMPFRNAFTYSVPNEFEDMVKVGVRVVVPFGKRVMTGFVIDVTETTDVEGKIKPIRDVLDEESIFSKDDLRFYEWISEYYLSSLGEALRNTVPYGSDVESKKTIVADQDFCSMLLAKEKSAKTTRAKILQAFCQKEKYKISQLQKLINKKSIYSVLKTLEKQGAVTILDHIEDAKVQAKKVKYIKLAKSIDEIYEIIPEIEARSPKQVIILLELLSKKEGEMKQSDLLEKTGSSQSSVKSLASKGVVEVFDKEVERRFTQTYEESTQKVVLTEDQSKIVSEVGQKINDDEFGSYLLYGVTGSGKTQVYIELVKQAIAKGKSALVLVPEISLTPQITSRFFNNLGEIVTVLHSRMSIGERYDSWRGIVKGKYKVVIGPRSALFAPLENIGCIIVDEEHDASYKQYEIVPKYHARDAAVLRAYFSKCPVVMGSATPSVESMYNSEIGKFKLLEMKKRIDDAKMPDISLVDVSLEKKKKKMEGVFSRPLLDKISDRLTKKEKIIILQNRRGFATQVFCEDCGELVTCPDCSVAMVHHLNRNILQCHYCGFTIRVPKACSNCGSISLKFFGTGTQKVEDELASYFPDANIERVDSDTINRKGKLGAILNSFRKGEIDILVGTQMVSKGLDFSDVTLVGVISAETTLWLPDFRADERTFQLLTQVAGRAGRSKVEGEVVIQTQNRNHFVLQKVVLNDYDGFYKNELSLRKPSAYPPFSRLALIETKDDIEDYARGAINSYADYLHKYGKGINILPPTPAVIARIKGKYRYQLVVKSFRNVDPSGKILRKALFDAYVEYNQRSRFRDIRLIIDIDPQSIM